MAGNVKEMPEWLLRLRAELMRDKKKTAMLSLLLVVAVVLGIRLVVRSLPSEAEAAVTRPPARAASAAGPAARPAPPEAEAGRPAVDSGYLQNLKQDFRRDIFKPNTDYFAPERPAEPERAAVEAKPTGPTPEEIAAAEARRLQAEREVIRKQAETLELQSIMLGARPTAMINDRVVRAGDEVDGFRVKTIDSGGCVVQKRDVEIRLNLRQ